MSTYTTPTVLEVTHYSEHGNYHHCKDPEGRLVRIDLLVDGSISAPEESDITEFCKSLVGKKVMIDYSHTYIHIAANPRVVEEAERIIQDNT